MSMIVWKTVYRFVLFVSKTKGEKSNSAAITTPDSREIHRHAMNTRLANQRINVRFFLVWVIRSLIVSQCNFSLRLYLEGLFLWRYSRRSLWSL